MTARPAAQQNASRASDDRLLLSAKEAARRLSISPRLLWRLTNTGKMPCVKLGRRVLYPADGLAEWVRTQTDAGTP
jgi:excisionase family DNA binding protein